MSQYEILSNAVAFAHAAPRKKSFFFFFFVLLRCGKTSKWATNRVNISKLDYEEKHCKIQFQIYVSKLTSKRGKIFIHSFSPLKFHRYLIKARKFNSQNADWQAKWFRIKYQYERKLRQKTTPKTCAKSRKTPSMLYSKFLHSFCVCLQRSLWYFSVYVWLHTSDQYRLNDK